MGVYDNFSFDYFDYLRGVLCTRTQEEIEGSQLRDVPPMGTQEGGGTQPSS
jgi:hypothetical protein